MLKCTWILILVFSSLPELIHCRRGNRKASKKSNTTNVNFDVITLAQNWPQTNCYDLNRAWDKEEPQCSPCKMINKSGNWTLHGLWPSSTNGTHPTECKKMKFQTTALSNSLRSELVNKWPTYNNKNTNEHFWAHEWKKHGTCALQLDEIDSVSTYFSRAIELLDKYNMEMILRNSNIVPGREYKITAIAKAIQKSLGVKGYITCARNKLTDQQFLSQINLCLDKSFSLGDCTSANAYLSNCKKKKAIIYPNNLKSC